MLAPANSEGPVSEGPMPTLLHLHGGPVAQHQYDFDIEQHIMASAGYRIVAPNPRGVQGAVSTINMPFGQSGVGLMERTFG